MPDHAAIPHTTAEPHRTRSAAERHGNGKEGKGMERKGSTGETPIMSSGSVPREPVDGMMLDLDTIRALDFHPTCSTTACKANSNPAAYAVRWARNLQPSLGDGVWLMCDPCWQAGIRVMVTCPSGVLWRVVEILR